jgi:hypothetical protein
MHKYSCDNDRRDYVSAGVLVICILLAYLISKVISSYVADIHPVLEIIVFILFLSPLTMWAYITDSFSALFLKFSGIMDCTGEYTGILRSSYDSFEKNLDVTVKIVHKFRNIEIRLDTSTSTSRSVTASLRQDGERVELIYTYENDGSIEMGLNRHIGTGIITIES